MTKKRKSFTILIIIIFIFATFSVGATLYAHAEVAPPSTFYINSESDIDELFCSIGAVGYQQNPQLTVVLNTDIYLQRRDINGTNKHEGMLSFSGTFDGRGHTISGFNLKELGGKSFNGIFGNIKASATIKNLNIVDAKVTQTNTGNKYIGILASSNAGKIDNVRVSGAIISKGAFIGGLVGLNTGAISDSYVDYNVQLEAEGGAFGGLVGKNGIVVDETTNALGSITNSYFSGTAKDSQNNALSPIYYIESTPTTPNVVDKGNYEEDINKPFLAKDSGGNYIINTIFDIMYLPSGSKAILNSEINIYNLNLPQAVLDKINATALFDKNGYGFYNCNTYHSALMASGSAVTDGKTLVTTGSATISGSGTDIDPYLVKTAADLQTIASDTKYSEPTIKIKLASSINLVDKATYFQPQFTSAFKGEFDGGNFAIVGVTKALFASNSGTIKNLYLRGKLQSQEVATLANSNSVTIQNVETNMALSAGQSALVGDNAGIISKCTINATGGNESSAVANNMNDGKITMVRNLSQLPFFGVYKLGTVSVCFNNNVRWLKVDNSAFNVTNSVVFDGGKYAQTADLADIWGLSTTEKGDWQWGGDNTWGFRLGEIADIPMLVFPSDGLAAYKEVIKIVSKNAKKVYVPTGHAANDITAKNYCTNYSGAITTKWYTTSEKTTEIPSGSNFSDVGSYYVDIFAVPTDKKTGAKSSAMLEITKATISLTDAEIGAIAGITSVNVNNSVMYKGAAYSIEQAIANILLGKAAITSPTITVSIRDYQTFYGFNDRASSLKDAGTYNLSLSASHKNYEIDFKNLSSVVFSITQKNLEITPSASETVKFNKPIGVVTYAASGLCASDSWATMDKSNLTFITAYEVGKTAITNGVKNQSITACEVSGKRFSNNYKLIGKSCYFEVVKGDIEGIAFGNATITYDGKYHTLAVTGVPNGGVVQYYKTATTIVAPTKGYIDCNAYGYDAVVSLGANYNDSKLTATLTIAKSNLNLKPLSYTITYGERIPNYQLEPYNLFVRDDGKSERLDNLIFSCEYPNTHNDANLLGYNITFSVGELANYNIIKGVGKLVVNKANPVVSLVQNTKMYNGSPFDTQYLYNGKLLVKDGAVSEVFEKDIGITEEMWITAQNIIDVGRYRVIVTIGNNNNYNAITLTFAFSISQRNLNNVVITLDGKPLGGDIVYDGVSHIIDIDKLKLPVEGAFTITYSYIYLGVTTSAVDIPISVEQAGKYTAIKILITDSNRLYGDYQLVLDVFTIDKAPIVINDMPTEKYTTQKLSPKIITNSELYGKVVNFTSVISQNGAPFVGDIVNVGEYTLTISCDNSNFYIVLPQKTYIVEKSVVALDFGDMVVISKEFGVKKNFQNELTFMLGGASITQKVMFNAEYATNGYLPVKLYNIIGVTSIYVNEVESIAFSVTNGGNKLSVLPKVITLPRWWDGVTDFKPTYNYTGNTIMQAQYKVDELELKQFKVDNKEIGVTINCDKAAINVGKYQLYLTVDNKNYTIKSEDTQFNFEVTPIALSIVVNDYSIKYGDQTPIISGKIVGNVQNDTIIPQYSTIYTPNSALGEYVTTATYSDTNYIVTITNGVLTVTLGELSGITIAPQTFVYNGSVAEPIISGAPQNATIKFGELPVNVGEYTVNVTISLANYKDSIVSGKVTITKATLQVEMSTSQISYKKGKYLVDTDIFGSATFGGNKVEGVFSFDSQALLGYGANTFTVTFTPKSANFSVVNGIEYKVEGVFTKDDVQIDAGGHDLNSEIVVDDDTMLVISIRSKDGVDSGLSLYINGELIPNGYYVISQDTANILVEIKFGNEVIRTSNISVKIIPPVLPEPPPEKPTEPQEKESNLGLIIGLAVGGGVTIIVGIIIAVVIIKKKKKNDITQKEGQ